MTLFPQAKTLILFCLGFTCLLLSLTSHNALAGSVDKVYQASTSKSAYIDIDELEFSLVPLTKAELAIEVDAWLTLLKGKATIVSEAEILVSQKQKKILAAQVQTVLS